MTLKERFIKESLDIRYQVLEPEKFEKIADDYAIEFAEWILKQYLSPSNDGLYINEEGNLISVKQLLEIFKKEKGL